MAGDIIFRICGMALVGWVLWETWARHRDLLKAPIAQLGFVFGVGFLCAEAIGVVLGLTTQ